VIRPRTLGRLLALGAVVAVPAACGHSSAAPTMASALEAVPLRLTGGQTLELQLAARQPATGACEPLAGGERLRIRESGLTVSVPAAAPAPATGLVRIVPHTKASYVVAGDGQARSWLDGTLAVGTEDDVAGFVGVDLGRTSPVAAARAVTWLARALDDAGAYAAVLHGPTGPPDDASAVWTATGATADGRTVTVRSTGSGADVRFAPGADPCAYRTAAG
jgi:hypothetical protein